MLATVNQNENGRRLIVGLALVAVACGINCRAPGDGAVEDCPDERPRGRLGDLQHER